MFFGRQPPRTRVGVDVAATTSHRDETPGEQQLYQAFGANFPQDYS